MSNGRMAEPASAGGRGRRWHPLQSGRVVAGLRPLRKALHRSVTVDVEVERWHVAPPRVGLCALERVWIWWWTVATRKGHCTAAVKVCPVESGRLIVLVWIG